MGLWGCYERFGVWGRVFEYEVFGIRADFTKYHGEIYNHLMRI